MRHLLKSTFIVSIWTFVSRLTGMIRDILAARWYGASAAMDAFLFAYRIANFMRNLFAEGCFAQAFVPVLSEYKQNHPLKDVRFFLSCVAGQLIFFLTLISLAGMISAPFLVKIFAPGYLEGSIRALLSMKMLRITFPYLLCISLTAFLSAILNSYNNFSVPAFTPILLNISLIMAACCASHYFAIPVEAQAWGVCIAGFIQVFFQLPFLYRKNLLVWPRLYWHHPTVNRIWKLMIPALFGASIGQLSILLNNVFASFLPIGSNSWLYNSERLAYFPLGVFGVALSTVVLPHLSTQHAQKSREHFIQIFNWGLRCNLFIALPAAISMFILAGPLVVTLFHYGLYTAYDVQMSQRSVWAYAIGLPAFMLVKLLTASFYAQQEIRIPARMGFIAIFFNILLSAILVWSLAHMGLALATALSSWVNVFLLGYALYKKFSDIFTLSSGIFIIRLFFANFLIAIVLYLSRGDLQEWLHWHWQARILHLLILGVGTVALYVFILSILGIRLKDLRS